MSKSSVSRRLFQPFCGSFSFNDDTLPLFTNLTMANDRIGRGCFSSRTNSHISMPPCRWASVSSAPNRPPSTPSIGRDCYTERFRARHKYCSKGLLPLGSMLQTSFDTDREEVGVHTLLELSKRRELVLKPSCAISQVKACLASAAQQVQEQTGVYQI